MRKILDVRWSNNVGFVRVEDPYEGIKYYVSDLRRGNTEEEDKQHIRDWGSTFPNDAGDVLFGVK